MNVLNTRHAPLTKVETKGQPLGKVGVVIIVVFIGMIFLASILSINAANKGQINIMSQNSALVASVRNRDTDQSNTLSWSWFKIQNPIEGNFDNSRYFGQFCEKINNQPKENVGDLQILQEGYGSRVDVDESSLNYLYCFVAQESGQNNDILYGGYVVRDIDLSNSNTTN